MTRCHGSSCDLIYDIDRFAQMKQQLDRQLQEIAFQEDPQLLFDRSFPGSTRSTFFSSGRSSPQVQVHHKRTGRFLHSNSQAKYVYFQPELTHTYKYVYIHTYNSPFTTTTAALLHHSRFRRSFRRSQIWNPTV